jgi:hypothetical protein
MRASVVGSIRFPTQPGVGPNALERSSNHLLVRAATLDRLLSYMSRAF